MGENVTISLKEYNELKRYKEIVRYIEEEIHEELSLRPATGKALEKLKRLHKEATGGKRKVLSEEEFLAAASG